VETLEIEKAKKASLPHPLPGTINGLTLRFKVPGPAATWEVVRNANSQAHPRLTESDLTTSIGD
jgi:hypothetical protein